jgi:hypothetical protein
MQDRLKSQRSERQVQIEKQIARLGLSINDMKRCQEFTSAWDVSLADVLRSALITSAIIAYNRPFSGNEEHEKATGHPLFSLSDLTQEEQQLHARLCDVRNQAIAHSDFGMSTSRALDFPGESGVLMATKMYEPLRESRWMPDIHALATKVERLLRAKLSDLAVDWRRAQAFPSQGGAQVQTSASSAFCPTTPAPASGAPSPDVKSDSLRLS